MIVIIDIQRMRYLLQQLAESCPLAWKLLLGISNCDFLYQQCLLQQFITKTTTNNGARHWYLDGKRHRVGAPAVVWYLQDGRVLCEEVWLVGKRRWAVAPTSIAIGEGGMVNILFKKVDQKSPIRRMELP